MAEERLNIIDAYRKNDDGSVQIYGRNNDYFYIIKHDSIDGKILNEERIKRFRGLKIPESEGQYSSLGFDLPRLGVVTWLLHFKTIERLHDYSNAVNAIRFENWKRYTEPELYDKISK